MVLEHKAVKGTKLQTVELLGHSKMKLESHVLDNNGRKGMAPNAVFLHVKVFVFSTCDYKG